jgi:hypothetical protein
MVRVIWLILLAACTGDPDDECTAADVFVDADGDGFGNDASAARRCPGPDDVTAGGDCDDADADVFPGAVPVCGDTSTDDDCDGAPDAVDQDGDGDSVTPCGGDCDDTSDDVKPSAAESCNTIDDDCDGLVDGADDSLVDPIACGVCPDPADIGTVPIAKRTFNPCVLDPTIESLCHRDNPDFVNTHSNGDRLHRILYRTDLAVFRDELLLYLPPGPGTNNDELLDWMAFSGYRVISLGWTNENSAFEPDDLFFENLRHELAYGEDTSPYIDLGPADAIVGRLTTLLEQLVLVDATRGWDAYFDANGIRWDRIVLTGWSEGGSQAGWLARNHLFDGVLLISAPKDVGGLVPKAEQLPPAPWVEDPRTTPTCRHFGFYHSLEIDPNPATDVLLLSWDAMDILPFGDEGVDADAVVPPYEGSQVLYTSKTDFLEGFGCSHHQAMAMDQCMHEDLAVPYNWLFCNVGVPTAACP